MTSFEFELFDRVEKIRSIDLQHNLREKSYVSFSGGKDSTILHYLIDLALPNNEIPRLFINTGIEYNDIVEYVKEMAKNDKRIIIVNSALNIKQVLEQYGYPFKSKEHSMHVALYQNTKQKGTLTKSVRKYLGLEKGKKLILCPKRLKYQFNESFQIKVSDKCCSKLKKEVASKFAKDFDKPICITGMRKNEGGQRLKISCIVTDKDSNLKKFHPLAPISMEFEKEFIETHNIKLCKLYYPPFNFHRTGCKGCPFSLDLQEQLDVMEELLPNERKQCELIWKPIYAEYRRIGYRLRKNGIGKQMTIFDIIEKE